MCPAYWGRSASAIGDTGAQHRRSRGIPGQEELTIDARRSPSTARDEDHQKTNHRCHRVRWRVHRGCRLVRRAPSDMHEAGKIETCWRCAPSRTTADLSMAYTPGVARVCHGHPRRSRRWAHTVHHQEEHGRDRVSDGTAVLGLGDIGPVGGAFPSWKARRCLFKEFAGVDAFPICLDTKAPLKRSSKPSQRIAPVFGGINLEDIAAPACIRDRRDRLKELARHPGLPRRPARDRRGDAGGAARTRFKLVEQGDAASSLLSSPGWVPPVWPSARSCMNAGVGQIVGADRQGAILAGSR